MREQNHQEKNQTPNFEEFFTEEMKSKITDLYVNQHCNPAFIIHQVKGEHYSNEIRSFLEKLVIKTHIEDDENQDSNDDDY